MNRRKVAGRHRHRPVLGWRILSEHEQEIVIGADVTAPVGICFMAVTDIKTTKNRLHLDPCRPEGNEFRLVRPKRTLVG
jgi:hypothetical protein